MEGFVKDLFVIYGPLALGWPISYILWKAFQRERKVCMEIEKEARKELKFIIKEITEALIDNNKVLSVLSERMKHLAGTD